MPYHTITLHYITIQYIHTITLHYITLHYIPYHTIPVHRYIHTYMHACIHTSMHAYIQTHTHTYIHTYIITLHYLTLHYITYIHTIIYSPTHCARSTSETRERHLRPAGRKMHKRPQPVRRSTHKTIHSRWQSGKMELPRFGSPTGTGLQGARKQV